MPEGSFDENHRPEISTLDAPEELLEDNTLKNKNKLETTARVLALIGGSGLLGGGFIATIGANPAINNTNMVKVGVNLCGLSTIIGFVGILILRTLKKKNSNSVNPILSVATQNENDVIVDPDDLNPKEREAFVNAINNVMC